MKKLIDAGAFKAYLQNEKKEAMRRKARTESPGMMLAAGHIMDVFCEEIDKQPAALCWRTFGEATPEPGQKILAAYTDKYGDRHVETVVFFREMLTFLQYWTPLEDISPFEESVAEW